MTSVVGRCTRTYYTRPTCKFGQTIQIIHYRYSHLHFKRKIGISSKTYTLIIQTHELDVRRGGGGGGGVEGDTDVRARRASGEGRKINKISILWVLLELLGLQNVSCLSKPTMNTCETISGHTCSVD